MIYDTQEEVVAVRKRDLAALEARRRKAMALLKKGLPQAEIARAVGVSRMTVMRWERLRKAKRNAPWKRRKLGRPPKGSRHHLTSVSSDLKGCDPSNGFFVNIKMLQKLAQVLERESPAQLHPVALRRARTDLGWSYTVPAVCQDQCL